MGNFAVRDSQGPLAGAMLRLLQEGRDLSIPSLRALSPLSDKAQVMVDTAVVEVGLERLQFAADLLSEGLTYPLADPLSITQVEWDQGSKVGGAIRTMSPSARGENALVDRKHNRVPIYCTQDDFSMGIRVLKMSERVGQPLDMTMVKQSTRRVNESIEDACINGATTADGQDFVDSGYKAPGLVNAPNANSAACSVDWTGSNTVGTTGPAIINDVLAAVTSLQTAKKFGPYNLYVGTKAGNLLEGDLKVYSSDTIRQRIEAIQVGGRSINVRVADRFPQGTSTGNPNFCLVQMTSDVVEIINGQPPTVIPWTSLDGFTLFWLVLSIMVPRVRSDYDGNSGVYLGTHT